MDFQFSLQKLLEVRERLEQQAAAKLGHLQLLEAEARKRLALKEDERERQLQAWREKNQGELDISELEAYQRWLEALAEAISQQRTLIDQLKESVKQQTEEFLATRRKREMLEKIREKEYAEFRKEMQGREQRELDDIAATRFVQQEAPFL